MLQRYTFSGTPREMGYQHGQALKEEIHHLYEQLMNRFVQANNPPLERSMLGVASGYLDVTEQFVPELIEEMEGIAEGADLDFEKVFFLNMYDDLGLYSKLREDGSHCTTFLATDTATEDGKTYLGQGWDMKPIFEPILIEIQPDEGARMLMLSHPGIVGGAGLNENGVALVWNTLKATDERIGVPVILLIRKVLAARNLNDALLPLLNMRRASGFNFIVGNQFGGFNIEATATKEYITYITDTFGHANNYEADLLREYQSISAARAPDTYIRTGRMRQLLQRNQGQINLNTCQEILCDHAQYPASICKHVTDDFYNISETKSGLIFIPEQKIMLASDGQPCQAGFDTFELNPS